MSKWSTTRHLFAIGGPVADLSCRLESIVHAAGMSHFRLIFVHSTRIINYKIKWQPELKPGYVSFDSIPHPQRNFPYSHDHDFLLCYLFYVHITHFVSAPWWGMSLPPFSCTVSITLYGNMFVTSLCTHSVQLRLAQLLLVQKVCMHGVLKLFWLLTTTSLGLAKVIYVSYIPQRVTTNTLFP